MGEQLLLAILNPLLPHLDGKSMAKISYLSKTTQTQFASANIWKFWVSVRLDILMELLLQRIDLDKAVPDPNNQKGKERVTSWKDVAFFLDYISQQNPTPKEIVKYLISATLKVENSTFEALKALKTKFDQLQFQACLEDAADEEEDPTLEQMLQDTTFLPKWNTHDILVVSYETQV